MARQFAFLFYLTFRDTQWKNAGWQNTPGTSQFILPFYPNQLFVWDVLEKNSVTCPLSMFRYIIFAILWKFLAKTLLLTNLQIFFVYIIRRLNKPQCYRQWVYRAPLFIRLKIKIWVVAYLEFINFFKYIFF